jgi:hypothetical protein
VQARDYPGVFDALFQLVNIRGALVTMPHEVSVSAVALLVFEQIPLYLEFFGFGKATPDELRAVAMLS